MSSNTLRCPVCAGENPPDTVFCKNPDCQKALGEFAYVAEEIRASASRLEKLADWIARFTAHPHFVTLHVVWFAI